MLVLSRTLGEELVIGNDIRIKVTDVSGNRIKVAISAPPQVSIRRGEIPAPVEDVEEFSVVLVDN